jgi:hypothetical protein
VRFLAGGAAADRAGADGEVTGSSAGCAARFGGSWNQLFLQLAQRTCLPLGPTALSGTT